MPSDVVLKMLLRAHADWFEYFGALVRTEEGSVPPFFGPYLNYVRRYPLGVVGQITPFNHPLLIAIKKLAPALAAGNSVVLKPSELAPITVLELGRIAQEVGPLLLSLHCYFRSLSSVCFLLDMSVPFHVSAGGSAGWGAEHRPWDRSCGGQGPGEPPVDQEGRLHRWHQHRYTPHRHSSPSSSSQ